MIGDGANGKSTFINVINKLLGTYGTTAASQTLVANGGSSIGDDLVDLVGARLITVSETEEGQSLAEAKIKQMTGGDTLKGRPLYGKHVEFSIRVNYGWLQTACPRSTIVITASGVELWLSPLIERSRLKSRIKSLSQNFRLSFLAY